MRRLLSSSEIIPVIPHLPNDTYTADNEVLQAHQLCLLSLVIRSLALPIGRGAFTLGTPTLPLTFTLGIPTLLQPPAKHTCCCYEFAPKKEHGPPVHVHARTCAHACGHLCACVYARECTFVPLHIDLAFAPVSLCIGRNSAPYVGTCKRSCVGTRVPVRATARVYGHVSAPKHPYSVD